MPVLQWVHPGLRTAPGPRASLIRQLAGRWDLREGTLRTALSRACATGSLEVSDGRYRIGPVSIAQAAAARALMSRVPGYTLCVVLEGEPTAEHGDRRPLRDLLNRQGFRPLQRSTWVGARTTEDRLSGALTESGFGRDVLVFQCDEVAADALEQLVATWRLAEREAELRSFHQLLLGSLTEPGLDRRERAWRCVEAAPVWYRVAIQDEPPFPLDLCGADYPLDALNTAWRDHLESVTGELVELWASEER